MISLFKRIIFPIFMTIVAIPSLGFLCMTLLYTVPQCYAAQDFSTLWNPAFLMEKQTYLYGVISYFLIVLLYMLNKPKGVNDRLLAGKVAQVIGGLENSRFMDKKERDSFFFHTDFLSLKNQKKDGLPVYAVYNKVKRNVELNLAEPMHALILGSTGSGKTTTFISPTIQILGRSAARSSMICTDPKGELFQLHSKMLQESGYKVMVLDLRDTYSSFRWNPLDPIFGIYQKYVEAGKGIFARRDDVTKSELKLRSPKGEYGEEWYEYRQEAFATKKELLDKVTVIRQRLYDEAYEDLNDIISVLCPIESEKDPIWDRGARAMVFAIALAMLEDSESENLGMTRERFCFYNLNKIVGNTEENYKELRNYFAGRSILSKAVGQSKQVLSAADETLSSYMSNAFDKMSMFNDDGLCALTSAMDIDPSQFANEPTALFLKIPDEKDTRHRLAAVFVLCIYKALIKVASAREELTLPRNVYFLLDEFGNMPKINKFENMITVGRSRKIWFDLVIQSYSQLNAVYGEQVAEIIKGNCGLKMFIGSNDIKTCEEYSKLCGNMTVSTASASRQMESKASDINISRQTQVRPLIYPSELQTLNNKKATGNAIIVTFGNNPLKTVYTPSYHCPIYSFGTMDISGLKERPFFGEDVFYDICERNLLVLDEQEEEDPGDTMERDMGNFAGMDDDMDLDLPDDADWEKLFNSEGFMNFEDENLAMPDGEDLLDGEDAFGSVDDEDLAETDMDETLEDFDDEDLAETDMDETLEDFDDEDLAETDMDETLEDFDDEDLAMSEEEESDSADENDYETKK